MVEINHKDRDHALLSASSAHRWLACPPSAVAAELYPEQNTEFTREGTLAHEVAEWVASGDSKCKNLDKGVDDGVTAEMLECAQAYDDYIQEQIKSDDATILLEQRVDFSPWVPDGFGTCDCIIIQGSTLTIIDYKYGKGVAVDATDNPQMKLYALGALNDFGIAYDVSAVEMHIFQPRINNISRDALPVDALLDWAEKDVKTIAAKAHQGKGKYNAGSHCTFCPHAGKCRKLKEVCTEFVETHDTRAAVPVLSPFELAAALHNVPLIKTWLKRIESQALATLLDGGEIPGFKVVEGKLGNRKWKDEQAVFAKLAEARYDFEDITETKLLTPAAMDKAIGKKKVAELLTQLIDRAPGAPVVVPANDKRPAYDRTADFENLE